MCVCVRVRLIFIPEEYAYNVLRKKLIFVTCSLTFVCSKQQQFAELCAWNSFKQIYYFSEAYCVYDG